MAQSVIGKISEKDDVHEFFLPNDMPYFCIGCYQCFSGNPERCRAYRYLKRIKIAISSSELIIITAPVYACHVPGQLKALLDHFAYCWILHQWDAQMVKKQALIISTATGGGIKSTVKYVRDSMDYWGVARVHVLKKVLFASHYTDIQETMKKEIEKAIVKKVYRIQRCAKNLTPRVKVKALFYYSRFIQRHKKINRVDARYWEKKGWSGRVRPWR